MRKRVIRFLLGTLYVVLLASLLITHTRQIAGEIERAMALLETLLLAVPSVVILILYARIKESEEKGGSRGERGRPLGQSPGQPPGQPPGPSEILSMEQLRERIEAVAQNGSSALTEREWEIAWLLYRGYTNRQIAEEFYIAETTVKKHASHIYEKLQVSGRKEFKEKYKK